MSTYRKLQVFNKTTDFAKAVKLVTVPLVDPPPEQVRVRHIYVGVNATDVNTAVGRFVPPNFEIPYDVGYEALGIVDSIGSAFPTGQLSIGQPVLVNVNEHLPGCYAEYSYKTLQELFPVPELKPDYLSAVLNGLTATLGLDHNGQIKANESVLITAAAGGVGQIAVQWAKQRGCHVIGTTSSEEKAKFLYEIGADYVINYRQQNLDKVLTEKYPNGIDVIWDTIGGDTFTTLLDHLAAKGRLVMAGSITSFKEESFDKFYHDVNISSLKLLDGSKFLTAFGVHNYLPAPEYLTKLVSGIKEGSIRVRIDQGERSPGGKFSGLGQIHRAVEWLYAGQNLGKVVVQIQNV